MHRLNIFTHQSMKSHCGHNGSFEIPSRLGTQIYKDSSLSNNYRSAMEKVHSPEYLQLLQNRCKQIGSIKWGCNVCSFINNVEDNVCSICYNHRELPDWEYLEMVDGDTTFINKHSFDAIVAAVTCACDLSTSIAKNIIPHGFALIRPPGHHACKDIGKGFCLVNNTAIAAEAALEAGVSKVFIFDWDLHHGDGIQDHFYQRSDVFYCSIHAEGIYPHTGRREEKGNGYNLNIPLQKGITDDEYLSVVKREVIPAIKDYNPDIILIAAGFDGLATDPIKTFQLTPQVYGDIINAIKQINNKIGLILEGGYDPIGIEQCVNSCMKALQQ